MLQLIKPSQSARESFSVFNNNICADSVKRKKKKGTKCFWKRMRTSQQEEGGPGYFLSAVCMFFHRPIDAFVGKETRQTIIDWRCEWLRVLELASQLQTPETGQIPGQTHFEEVIFTTFGVKSVIWSVSEVSCARGQ